MNSNRSGRRYDREFKSNAVRSCAAGERSPRWHAIRVSPNGLSTDHEWSCAVGIGDREDPDKSPEEKSGKIDDVFP
jgi:hypothetical protein